MGSKEKTSQNTEKNKQETLKFMSTLDSCLCESDSKANDIDHSRSLFITDQTLLSELDAAKYSFSNLMKNMNDPNLLIRTNGVDPDEQFHIFVKRYLDNMVLTDIPDDKKIEGEFNDIQPLNSTHDQIVSRWEKVNRAEGEGQRFTESSPYKLIGIVFRPDLIENDDDGNLEHAGEGRFIYQLLGNFNSPVSHFVILEYKLAMGNGTLRLAEAINNIEQWDRKKWNEEWARLSCLEISSSQYRNQLEKVLDRVALVDYDDPKWSNKSPIGQVRVNDFINGSPWALFENQLEKGPGPNQLERHRMINSPKDNFVTSSSGAVGLPTSSLNKPLSPTGSKEIIDFAIAQKDKIANLNENYELPEILTGWQNTYSINANWGREFHSGSPSFIPDGEAIAIPFNNIDESIISNSEKTMIKYRFALNSCSSCHMDGFTSRNADYSPSFLEAGRSLGFGDIPFSQNTLDENKPSENGGFETINIRGSSTPFFHFAFGSDFSAFLKEDLIHREDELEFQLSVASCEDEQLEEEIVDISIDLEVSNENPVIGEEIVFEYTGVNVGNKNIINLEITNVDCPEGFSLSGLILQEENNDVDWSGGSWILKNIAPGVSKKLTLNCSTEESLKNTTINYELKEENFNFSAPQVDNNLENHLISKELKIKESINNEIVDIGLSLEIDKLNPEINENVNFQIEATNLGDIEVKDFRIKNILCPSEFSISNVSIEGNTKIEARDWLVSSLSPGNIVRLVFNCKVLPTTKGKSIEYSVNTNQFVLNNNQLDENIENHEIGTIIEVRDSLAVDIETKINPFGFESVKELQEVSYRVELNNLGPDEASSVSTKINCPAGTELIGSPGISAGIFNISDKLWVIGSIGVNKLESINLTCKINANQAGKTISFLVKSEDISTTERDINRANENSNIDILVIEKQKESDLELFSSINKSSPAQGEEVAITLGVINKGPDVSGITSIISKCPEGTTEVRRSVTLPSSKLWTLNSIEVDSGDRSKAKTQVITCKVDQGTTGKKIKFEIPVTDVFVAQADSNKSNNTTSVDFEVRDNSNDKKVSDIKSVFDVTTPNVKAGEKIFLRLQVENLGPEVAEEIKYSIKCPEQLNTIPEVVSISNGSLSVAGKNGEWLIRDLNKLKKVVLSYSCATTEAVDDKKLTIKLDQSQLNLGEKNVDNNIGNHISENIEIDVSGFRVCDLDLGEPEGISKSISSTDLVRLQRHILGISLIGAPADNPNNKPHLMNVFGGKKLDINGDGRVSAADLVDIRKWILGLFPSWQEAFKNNRKVDDCDIFRPFENNRFEAIKGN